MNLGPIHFVIGLFFAVAPSVGLAAANDPQVFDFAAGWRTAGAHPENVLQIGTIYPCDAGRCAEVEEFHGADNLPRQKLSYRHAMRANSGATSCKDDFIATVKGRRILIRGVAAENTSAGYVILLGSVRYTWDSDKGRSAGSYTLQDVSTVSANEHAGQPIGFAYWSESIAEVRFGPEQFKFYFDGDIAHKDMLKPVEADWLVKPSTMHLERFVARDPASPVLSLTVEGEAETLKRIRKRVKVESSVLPPEDAAGDRMRLRYFVNEYGHDFNGNGCFDESGHNKLMLPVWRNQSVTAFVYVEYTPDPRDHVPMISVGRYFRKM